MSQELPTIERHTVVPAHSFAPFNVANAMQFVLGFCVLAGLPISVWLFVSTHMDERIDKAIMQNNLVYEQQIKTQQRSIEGLVDYAFSLCVGVRKIDQTFSCGSAYYQSQYQPPPVRR